MMFNIFRMINSTDGPNWEPGTLKSELQAFYKPHFVSIMFSFLIKYFIPTILWVLFFTTFKADVTTKYVLYLSFFFSLILSQSFSLLDSLTLLLSLPLLDSLTILLSLSLSLSISSILSLPSIFSLSPPRFSTILLSLSLLDYLTHLLSLTLLDSLPILLYVSLSLITSLLFSLPHLYHSLFHNLSTTHHRYGGYLSSYQVVGYLMFTFMALLVLTVAVFPRVLIDPEASGKDSILQQITWIFTPQPAKTDITAVNDESEV